MKCRLPIAVVITIAIFSLLSCTKSSEDIISSCSLADVDRTNLSVDWVQSEAQNTHLTSYPIPWKNQVICAISENSQAKIAIFEAKTGNLLWSIPIFGLVLENNLKLSGDKLLWVNERSLWSLDLQTQTISKVLEFQEGLLNTKISIWHDLVVCTQTVCSPNCDTAIGIAYLVNLQTGLYQEVFRSTPTYPLSDLSIIKSPLLTTNFLGDTLLCFIQKLGTFGTSSSSNRFICKNITQGTLIQSDALNNPIENLDLHLLDESAFMVVGDTIYCCAIQTGEINWKRAMRNASITIKERQIFATSGSIDILKLDPNSGQTLWNSTFIGQNIESLQSVIVQNNQLYLIGAYALCTLDCSTGCLLKQQYTTTPEENLGAGLALSTDSTQLYLRKYPSLIAVRLPD